MGDMLSTEKQQYHGPSTIINNKLHCKSFWSLLGLRACLHGGGGPQIGEVTCSRSPYLSCKRDPIEMRDYMNRLVTPPKRVTSPKLVTSPTWSPSTPCKQALRGLIPEWS